MEVKKRMSILSPSKYDQIKAFKSALEEYVASERGKATNRELSDMYHTNLWAYSAANYWANKVASIPFRLYDPDGNEVLTATPDDDVYPLWTMLSHHSFNDMMRKTEISMRFFGYSLSRKERNVYKVVRDVKWVNPFLYSRQGNGTLGITGFQIYQGRYQDNPSGFLKLEDAVYFKEMVNFADDSKGTSSAETAFLQASASTEIAMTQYASFLNLAIPAAIVQPPAPNGNPSPINVGDDEAVALTDWLTRFFKGAKNAARTWVSATRWEWIQLTANWADQIPTEQEKALREAVAAAFDLPIEFITTGQTNYAELSGKILTWKIDRFMPRVSWYGHYLTDQLCNEPVYWGYSIKPDFAEIVYDVEQTRLDYIERKRIGSYISLASAQKELGVPVDPAFEDLYWYEGYGYVPKSEFANLWKYKLAVRPSEYNVGMVTGEPLPEPVSPELTVPTTDGSRPLSREPIPDNDNAEDYVPEAIYKEIAFASRRAIKSIDFVPNHLPESTARYIRCLSKFIDNKQVIVKAAKSHYLSVTAEKSVQSTRLSFEDKVEDLLDEALNGSIDKGKFKQILRNSIRVAINQAYLDGLTDGGIEDARLSDEDKSWISTFAKEQTDYVSNLADAIYEDNRVTEDEVVGKPAMWWNMSVYPAYTQGVLNASDNAVMLWVMNRSKENCDSCIALDGYAATAKTWEQNVKPKDPRLDCNGFKCGCELVPYKGKPSWANFPDWEH
jgi:hypothetical protein